jgi:hypothetical protein
MSTLEKLIYTADILWFLLLGLLTPLVPIPEQALALSRFIIIGLDKVPLVTLVVVIIVAATSGAMMYILVRVEQHQKELFLPFIKMFIIGLPAVAVGHMAAIALGWLGLGPYEAAWKGWAFLAVGSVAYLCGGIGGILAMKSAPRRKQGT